MKASIDCIPCFFEQAIRAGRIATKDEKLVKKITDQIGLMLGDISLDDSPPEIGRLIYKKVSEISGNPDPYRQIKYDCTQQALALYPTLKTMIQESVDPLLTAIRLAIAGNVIDFGANATFDIEKSITEIIKKEFAIFDYKTFKEYLSRARQILYLGDNAGETVFDKLLIEQFKVPVVYVVRGKPVINDAVKEDALQAGLDKVATIVSSGTDVPGTILSTCSPEFRELYDSSEFVISKGQGNYEALSDEKKPIFFLLKVKCNIIAEDIGIENGDIVLKGNV